MRNLIEYKDLRGLSPIINVNCIVEGGAYEIIKKNTDYCVVCVNVVGYHLFVR